MSKWYSILIIAWKLSLPFTVPQPVAARGRKAGCHNEVAAVLSTAVGKEEEESEDPFGERKEVLQVVKRGPK